MQLHAMMSKGGPYLQRMLCCPIQHMIIISGVRSSHQGLSWEDQEQAAALLKLVHLLELVQKQAEELGPRVKGQYQMLFRQLAVAPQLGWALELAFQLNQEVDYLPRSHPLSQVVLML